MNEDYQVDSMDSVEGYEDLSEETACAVDDDWYGDDHTGSEDSGNDAEEETGDETQEADQPTEEVVTEDNKTAEEAAAPEQEPEEAKAAEADKADQLFTLKHLDETKEVSREEVIALAQKGLDYDRKVGRLNDELSEYKGFFEELAANSGLNRDQFMDSVRAKLLVAQEERQGRQLAESEAIFRVQSAKAEKANARAKAAAEEQQRITAAEQKRAAEAIKAFTDAYPDVKRDDIPKSVWDDMSRNGDLLGAYTRHIAAQTAKENAELKKRIETLEQNAKNSARSTGSRKTAGNTSSDSEFDKLWYDGT